LIVNPYHVEESADFAAPGPDDAAAEQRERMASLRMTVREYNVIAGRVECSPMRVAGACASASSPGATAQSW